MKDNGVLGIKEIIIRTREKMCVVEKINGIKMTDDVE